ncbi:valine--tRNA ligase [Candidatus Peribacteria bacterium RIFCSPHIGHO2_01_FULL_51_9]|nr:MAG: valine--tRNA ligase [Candidatus Peribacteria bacterium RIFCSPHIGHO2_01_FULL_51_9]
MLPKAYDPKSTEDRIYKMWEESGAFRAENTSKKEPFTISMPPPNATGQLHIGNSMMLAIEDILIRFHRMNGKEALWIPGTDHAAIATESVVIRKIQKEEKIPDPRAKLGREELLRRIAEYVAKSQGSIRSQMRKMGASCDWSRERYTFEPALNRCVNEVFKKMYDDGLIYRGERVVNWDTALQTTISDDEIEYEDTEAILYTIEYVSASETGGDPIFVATSRPETKLGDNALAVHPDDARYKHLIGRHFKVCWPHGQTIHVTVIADHTIDPAFGTGVLGVTPFHSKLDFEMWQRHKETVLNPPMQVIGEDGCMTENAGPYAALSVLKCREQFVTDLREEGRIRSEEKYMQPLSISYRSKKPVEPLPKLQWFIDVNKKVVSWKKKKMSLKEVMHKVVKNGDVRIIPERFEKTYFHWIDNLQDWCISRQIWWGHRVPVWYCVGDEHCLLACKTPMVSVVPPEKCPACGSKNIAQDPDTLDTWFSSALWTWSTLIDKRLTEDFSLSLTDLLKKSPDFQKFHPTQVMETGYDILFFWVARMILMTTYATGQIPFETVYLHGLVRTRDGKKMSKSDPSTCIDPLDMSAQYGTDALRMSMIVGQSAGNDFRLYEEKIAGYRNFVNKLWNASRFALMQCENSQHASQIDPKAMNFDDIDDPSIFESSDADVIQVLKLSPADEFILEKLQDLIVDATEGLKNYRLSEVGEKIYAFIWNDYCDWYLESRKIYGNDTLVMIYVLKTVLKLLHPYCPFVTEELWSNFAHADEKILINQEWPCVNEPLHNWLKRRQSAQNFEKVIDVVSAIRSLRAEHGFSPKSKITVEVNPFDKVMQAHTADIERLANLEYLHGPSSWVGGRPSPTLPQCIVNGIQIVLIVNHAYNSEELKAKLLKEKEKIEAFIKGIENKLGNKKFVENAPEDVVNLEKEKLAANKEKLKKVEERLSTF